MAPGGRDARGATGAGPRRARRGRPRLRTRRPRGGPRPHEARRRRNRDGGARVPRRARAPRLRRAVDPPSPRRPRGAPPGADRLAARPARAGRGLTVEDAGPKTPVEIAAGLRAQALGLAETLARAGRPGNA